MEQITWPQNGLPAGSPLLVKVPSFAWAIEVKTGSFDSQGLKGLLEFCRCFSKFRPLVITRPGDEGLVRRHHLLAINWKIFYYRDRPQPLGDRGGQMNWIRGQ